MVNGVIKYLELRMLTQRSPFKKSSKREFVAFFFFPSPDKTPCFSQKNEHHLFTVLAFIPCEVDFKMKEGNLQEQRVSKNDAVRAQAYLSTSTMHHMLFNRFSFSKDQMQWKCF
jgi:hypothetical protein